MEEADVVLEEITHDECLALLAGAQLGRLGVVDGDQPIVVPVNFAYTPDGLVVLTDVGQKFDAARQRRAALEVDDIDLGTRQGWSVLVQGHCFDVTDTLDERSERLRSAAVETWVPGPKARRLVVEITKVTGRRLRRA